MQDVLRIGAALAVLTAFALPALAELGGSVSTVEADRAHMNAGVRITSGSAYDVHEIASPSGTVVDEYVSPAGKVFAVTWHGQFMPDLQQILGPAYFQQYAAALAAREKHFGHRPLNIQQPGLVVQTSGHMRDYFGRAYVPSMLPEGVKADDIR
ncbi:MAG TPA: DUF2844 domain-containing protein [Acidobacteriaceae bacterium]